MEFRQRVDAEAKRAFPSGRWGIVGAFQEVCDVLGVGSAACALHDGVGVGLERHQSNKRKAVIVFEDLDAEFRGRERFGCFNAHVIDDPGCVHDSSGSRQRGKASSLIRGCAGQADGESIDGNFGPVMT